MRFRPRSSSCRRIAVGAAALAAVLALVVLLPFGTAPGEDAGTPPTADAERDVQAVAAEPPAAATADALPDDSAPAARQAIPTTPAEEEPATADDPWGALQVRVLEADGSPAPGVEVRVRRRDGQRIRDLMPGQRVIDALFSDENGELRFERLPAGALVVEAATRIPMMFDVDEEDTSAPRPPLAEVEVRAGAVARAVVDLGTMAGLRVTVRDDDGPVADAEVSIEPVKVNDPADLTGRFPWTHGTTGADGAVRIRPLVPGRRYLVSARAPKARRQYELGGPWTQVEFTPYSGDENLTIRLPRVSLSFVIAGRMLGPAEVSLSRERPPYRPPPDAPPRYHELAVRYAVSRERAPIDSWMIGNHASSGEVALGRQVVVPHLPAGLYRLRATVGEEWRAIGPEFRVDDQDVDLGTLTLQRLHPIEIELPGIEAIEPDLRDELELFCVPASGDRARWAENDLRPPLALRTEAGAYHLALRDDTRELARSPRFQVTAETETWTWPLPPSLDRR